jgi:hypothetical protein
MKASDNPFPSILIDEEVDPAAPAAGHKRLFIDSADHILKTIDSASAVVTYGTGIADQGTFTYLDATEDDAPGTPASGYARIYAKADGRIYSKDDAGTEYGPFDAAGGAGGPLLAIDDVALHALGDDFDDDELTDWTLGGGLTTGDVTAVTTEVYDDTALDIVFGAQGDYMYKAVPGTSDYEASLTILGMDNAASSPTAATNAMLGLAFVDNSGNGTGFSLYGTGAAAYMWGVTGWQYASTGSAITIATYGLYGSSGMTIILKLKRVGTTITGSLSVNGGTIWQTVTRSDSTTFTRIGIVRLYSDGGTDPKLRVGRFNVEEL